MVYFHYSYHSKDLLGSVSLTPDWLHVSIMPDMCTVRDTKSSKDKGDIQLSNPPSPLIHVGS